MMAAKPQNRREELRQQQAAAAAQQTRFIRIITIGVVVLAVVLIGVFVVAGMQAFKDAGDKEAAAVTPPNATASQTGIAIEPGAPANKPEVILYVDYQCPACGNFERVFGAALAQMAKDGEIRYSQTTLSFMDRNLGNDSSSKAANAAVCADQAGAYAAYNSGVFTHQSPQGAGYADDVLRDLLPTQVGITGEKLTAFQQCYDQRLGKKFTEAMDKGAYEKGVTSTPTITVNGTKLDNASLTTPEALKEQILAQQAG